MLHLSPASGEAVTCANHRTVTDAQCLWCEVNDLRHLLGESEAQALRYLAEVERLKGMLHSEIICEMHYCERHEMAYQRGEFVADPKCPHCECEALEAEIERLRAALHRIANQGPNDEPWEHWQTIASTALRPTSATTKGEP